MKTFDTANKTNAIFVLNKYKIRCLWKITS